MAKEITLEALAKGKEEAPRQELQKIDAESIKAQVETLSPEQRARVEEIKDGIDLMDSQQLIQYGVGAQKNISGFSDHILSQIRSKDSGYVGELMTDLVVKVKEAEADSGDEGFLDNRYTYRSCSSGMRSWRFRSIRSSSSWIRPEWRCLRISPCSTACMRESGVFQELQIYIAAGEEKIKEIQMETLPKLREEAKAKGIP